jgi:quercetin dioxygenase-like cupin family protein
MITKLYLPIAVVAALFAVALSQQGAATDQPGAASPSANLPIFQNLADLKWGKIIPELGADSPEICILHVDPTSHATKLIIRSPKGIHVRKHWHTGNETHTIIAGTASFACDGKRVEQTQGSFNFLPARMVHEAWLSPGLILFITVDAAWDVNWVEGPPTAADLMK